MSTEANKFLASSGGGESHPAIKFATIGDAVAGIIIDDPEVVMRDSLKDGSPEPQMPINLDTGEGGLRTLWVRRGFLAGAINDAVKASGASGLEVGGKLGVRFSGERDTGKPNPAREFTAKYEPPKAKPVDLDEIF